MDRRVQATQQKAVYALRQLMQRYSWETITVATICQESSISRSTFYSHFASKEDLMQLSLEFLAHELVPADTRRGLNNTCTLKFLPPLLSHIKSHREILEKNLDTAAAGMILGNLRKTIEGLVHNEIQRSHYADLVANSNLIFMCGGLFAIIEQWTSDECRDPAEKILATIDIQIRSALLALK